MEDFKKITEEIYWEDDWDLKKNVCDKVYSEIIKNVNTYKHELEYSLLDCESPIEQLLAINLEKINLLGIGNFNPFIDVVAIQPQQEIEINNRIYRVDFLITVEYKNQGIKGFVIECDGHEFHQKTKEQVEKDNQRTRDLQMKGLEVIRFSGTEIWHRSLRCAYQVKDLILSKCEYIKEIEV